MKPVTPTQRRICWPKFDELCLTGGCIHCNNQPFRGLLAIGHQANLRNLGTTFRLGVKERWFERIDYK